MARIKICKEPDCSDAATTKGYCRLHYLRNWREIKANEERKSADKLNKYVEYMCQKYPTRYIEEIRDDLNAPNFEEEVSDELDFEKEGNLAMDEPSYEEEIDNLIKKLKIEKGF